MTTKICIESPRDKSGDYMMLESWAFLDNEPRFVILNNRDTTILTTKQMVTFLQECLEYLEAWAHRCRSCPECAVIFDSEGIHGHVPDRNSNTCRACERNREVDE